jgi:alkanesulfonate monooxygenase SsuD/methylene tetrahydromethanopterin reductase-like flavin-dependent oxidoreductase (luciferase family)
LKFGNWLFPISLSPSRDGEAIANALNEVKLSEDCGFHSVWLNEHHFDGSSAFADPVTFASAIGMCTETIKIGFAVLEIALHHPVRLAAQCALIDHLTKGRLIVGLGRGSVANHYEYEGFDVSMEMGAGALEEAEDLLIKAWTQENVTHQGRYWNTKFPAIRPVTYSQPHPQLIRSAISDGSISKLAESCRPFLTGGSKPSEVIRKLSFYRDAATKAGHQELEIESAVQGTWFATNIVVSDTFADARRIAEKYLSIEQKFFSDARRELNSEEWVNSAEGQKWLVHDTLEDGFIYGSVDDVSDQISEFRAAGVHNLMLKVNSGQMDYPVIEKTIKLLGEQIIPNFL